MPKTHSPEAVAIESAYEDQVQAMFKAQLGSLRKRLDDVVSQDLGNFNRLLREKNIGNVIGSQ